MFKKILLFGLLTIIISVIMVSAYEDKFPRVAYTPPYRESDSTYNQYFAQAVDTLHLTALIQNIPHFQDLDFNAATSYHLNLVNTNATITFDASSGQYSMYQADRHNDSDYFQPPPYVRFLSTKYDNAGHGQQVEDSTVNPHVFAWFVSKDNPNDTAGYVLDSLWNETLTLGASAIDYSREQDRTNLWYYVNFRLKVPVCSSCSASDSVAKVDVISYSGADTTILAESLLTYGMFSPGQYQSFLDSFHLPDSESGKAKDYRVYWYKNTDLYIDYVEVYDYNYNHLFKVPSPNNSNMTDYQWQLIHDPDIDSIEVKYHGSSLYRWLLTDEPTYDQYKSSRRVNEILADNVSKPAYAPGVQATADYSQRNTYRYVNEVDPKEVFYDDYPILSLVENNNDILQLRLDNFADWISKANDAAKSKGKEWWYIAQTYKDTTTGHRYPHNSELKATVYMALAYGAKGIGYFEYASRSYSDGPHGGLVDSITTQPVVTYPYEGNNYYSNYSEILFEAVRDINRKLDTLGPILKGLEWRWAGPGDSVATAPGSFVASVSGVQCGNCTGWDLCKDPTLFNHIQVGMFRDNGKGEDYLMLVNRWVAGGERPCEMVELQKDRYSYLYDCLSGNFLDTLSGTSDFYVYLLPGDCKLLRLANFLAPINLSGSVVGSPQKIRIHWTDTNRNETSYRVERKLASQTQWPSNPEIGSTPANVTIYYDTNLTGSETYNYRVRASDGQYYSEYSNEITVKNIPNPPRNLTAHLTRICCPGRGYGASGSGIGINGICLYCWTNEIILSWQAPQNQKLYTLANYKVKAWRADTTWTDYQTVSVAYTSLTFCVPAFGKSYYFEVYAIDSVGNQSNASNRVNITSGTTDNCGGGGGGEPQAKIVAQVIPEKFELFQNYPNPSNAGTLIKYALPQEVTVKLVIYNILGQKVRVLVEDLQEPGYYTISWDGKNEHGSAVGSGIYFYRIRAGSLTKTAKMSLLK